MFRSYIGMAALTPLFAASLAMGQSGYDAQRIASGQAGALRLDSGSDGQAIEVTPQGAGDARFFAIRPPGATLSIGISVSPVQPVMASQLRLRKGTGLVVDNVAPGSAAEQAGIQRYDIIERINNRNVASVGQVEQMLRGNKSGDHVPFLIIRQGDRQNLEVRVEPAPQGQRVPMGQQLQKTPESQFYFSPKDYVPNRFQLSPDQTRELQQMSDQLKKEVEQQERQIERLKENLRREADQARRELEQLKEQIRRELEQQKQQMLDQLKTKPDSSSDKRDEPAQPNRS